MDTKKLCSLLHQELNRRSSQNQAYDWETVARPSQKIPKGPWRIWLILAGRGFGKTRTGAESIRTWATKGMYRRICLLGHHFDDVRRVMIEGESGLLSISSPQEKLKYEPSKRQLLWPNGAVASAYSASAYSQLRGPQFDAAWIDELAKFPYAQEAWDQLMLCLRLGHCPRVIITTTPRPLPLIKDLIKRPDVVVTRGNTFDNQAHLSPNYLDEIKKTYEGTRLGAQEIQGEMIEEGRGLWKSSFFRYAQEIPSLSRIIVAIDPAVTYHHKSDETGMIVAGKDDQGRGYILEDLSGRFSPTEWMSRAIEAYKRYQADRVVAEVNNGGEIVRHLLSTLDATVAYRAVQATRSKIARAEPISALYEQGKIFHARYFPELENQLMAPDQKSSPDRMDALVWALTELFLTPSVPPKILSL